MHDLLPPDSFFLRWLRVWPLAEPPQSYIVFAAMAMLGAALGRRVFFDQDVHTLFPMLNVLLIGPSGIGKSTSISMGLRLLERMPEDLRPYVVRGKATKEKLHSDLCAANRNTLIVASELANFFSKERYNEGMIPYITQLLDYEKEVSVRTKIGNIQTLLDPKVSVIGGSTVPWLQEQLPSTATEGGFLPRFFIVKEDHKGQRVALPKRMLTRQQLLDLEKARELVFSEFVDIASMYQGPMDFADYAAEDAYTYWYQTFMPDTGSLSPFAARAGEYVLRLSMLMALSRWHTTIEEEDVKCAIRMHQYSIGRLQEVVVPMTPQGKMLAKVLEIIGTDSMSDVQVKRAMRNYASSMDVEKMLISLMQSKDLMYQDGIYRRAN